MARRRATGKRKTSSGRTKRSGLRQRGASSKSKGQANVNGNTDECNHNPQGTNELDGMPHGSVFLEDKASPLHRPSHINNFINANSGRSSACSDEGHYSRCSSSTPSSDTPPLGSYNFDGGHLGTPSMKPPSMKTPSLFSQSFDSSMDASSLDCESIDASTCGIAGTPRNRHSILEISSSMDDSSDDIRARKRTEKRKRYRKNKRLRVLAALHMKDLAEEKLSEKLGEATFAHDSLRHTPIKASALVIENKPQPCDSTSVKERENCDEIVDEGFSENCDKAQRKECEDTFKTAVSQDSCESLNANNKDICITLANVDGGKDKISGDLSNGALETLVLDEKKECNNEQKQVDGEEVNEANGKGQGAEDTVNTNEESTSSTPDDCASPAEENVRKDTPNVGDNVLKDAPNNSDKISSSDKDGIEEIETVHCTRAVSEEISSAVINDNIHLINPNDKLELVDVIETNGCSETLVVLEMKGQGHSISEEDSETEDGEKGEDEQVEIQIVEYDDGELVDILEEDGENGEEKFENGIENNISGKDAIGSEQDSEVNNEVSESTGQENKRNKETEVPVSNVNRTDLEKSCQEDAANGDIAEKFPVKVDAALAELDSIPDGVCESGEVEEEEEEEEEWSYYRMEPQTQPQGEDILGVTATSTSPKEDVEIIPEPSDMVQDQNIVPVPEQKDNTDVANIDSANLDIDSPFEHPPNNDFLDNLIKEPIIAEKTDIVESNMDVIPSLDDHPERLINFSGPGLEKSDMDINMEQSSPHGSGSPKVPGSPRSVEGFVTSVELNTPDESFATNFAVNQAQDAFTGGIVDQTSGPFSVYVSSSPEPASLDPPQQASIDLLNMSNGMTNGQMDDEHSPMNEAQVALEESPAALEESPVEIVHAQSTVEVVAPPSPVEVSGPETQFIMPDEQVPDVPSSAQMPPTDISFVPQPVIEPTAEVPVPVYVDDTPVSESDLILDNQSNTAEIPSPTTFESENMMQMDMQSSIILESSFEVVSEQCFEASKTEVSETVSQMETTTSHFETDNEANQNEFSNKSVSPVPALSPVENAISSPVEPSPVENAFISSPIEASPVVNDLIPSPVEATPVENAFISSPVEASPVPKELDNVPAEPSPVEEKEPIPPIMVNDVVTPVETELVSPPVNIPEEVSDAAEISPKTPDVKTKSPSPTETKVSKTPKTPGKAVSDKTPAKGTPGKPTPSKTTAAKATPTSRTPSAKTPSSKTPTTRTPLTKSAEKKTPVTKSATPSRTPTTKPSTAKPTSATTKSAPAKTTAPKPASRLAPKTSSTTTTSTTKSLSTTTKPSSTAAKAAPRTAGVTPPKPAAAKTTTRPLPSARTTTTTKSSTSTARTSTTTTTARKPVNATKSTDKPDSATTRPTSRPGVAKPSSTTTRRPAPGSAARTAAKPGAEKETKNTTNQILSSRPAKPATSATARTTGARSSTAHSTSKTASANTATKRTTTALKTTGAATKKTLVSKSKTTSTKEAAVKNETSVIEKAEPLVNGENKIADEETSVEVIEKSAVEDIMIASSEKVITETMSSEQVLVTTEATEVLVNGDH